VREIRECICGHFQNEHSAPDSWDDEDDTFCSHEFCNCPKFEAIENIDPPTKEER